MNATDTAYAAAAAALSVLPPREDGTKAPQSTPIPDDCHHPDCIDKRQQGLRSGWIHWSHTRPDPAQLARWYPTASGVGIVCGAVSGGLEMFEFEGRAIAEGVHTAFRELCDAAGIGDVLDRVRDGYCETSPSGGVHLLYRVTDGAASDCVKLAQRPPRDDELTETERDTLTRYPGKVFWRPLIEVKGEGGYTIVAPTNGRVHPDGGAWQILAGGIATIATITADERDELHRIARMLHQPGESQRDELREQMARDARRPTVGGDWKIRPGDDYNTRSDPQTRVRELLEADGWTKAYTKGDVDYIRRPGKRRGMSATLRAEGTLYVFTTATEFEALTPYTPFGVYALLEHRGDYKAAAKALHAAGYGESAEKEPTAARTAARTAGARGKRPGWDVTNAAVAADQLREAIGQGPLAGMLNRGGEVVHTPREGEDGYTPPSDDADHDGPAQVRPITASELASRISFTYTCHKIDKHGERHEALFPIAAARVAVDVPDMLPNLRPLRGVTHTPIVRRDGTILTAAGYDSASRLLHLPDPTVTLPPIPDRPSKADVKAAVDLIDEMLDGFDFVTDSDRANYIGLLITPLLRELYPPPYKLGAITAPQPGSGKSLLAAIMRIIHGGVFRAEVPAEDGELRKQITAILDVTTGPVVQFDNVTGVLRSSTLAGLLTSNRWDDRRLGATEMVSRRNDRLWVLTGNNVALGGDIPRRAVCVTIDPKVPQPHLRTDFEIPNLEQWVHDHRGQLIAAMLTMIRAWVVEGSPTRPRAGDGYARWVEAVDGILDHAGLDGTFDHVETKREAVGADDADWRDLLAAAWQAFGTQQFTSRELLYQVNTSDFDDPTKKKIPVDALPSELMEKALKHGPRACVRSLGKWLANRDGRWAGEYTVRNVGENRAHQKIWQIEVTR